STIRPPSAPIAKPSITATAGRNIRAAPSTAARKSPQGTKEQSRNPRLLLGPATQALPRLPAANPGHRPALPPLRSNIPIRPPRRDRRILQPPHPRAIRRVGQDQSDVGLHPLRPAPHRPHRRLRRPLLVSE